MTDILDVTVKIPNNTKMPYDRWQLSFEVKKTILARYPNLICKSKQSMNGGIEAEIHATYDKDFLYFQFRLTNTKLSTISLKDQGQDCKKGLEEKFKLDMIVLGTLQSDSGKKENLIF